MEDFHVDAEGRVVLHSPVVMAAMVLLTFLIRAIDPGQPIVENYVGRQVPTAMVARNFDRGSGFFGRSSIRLRFRITSSSSRRFTSRS